MKFLLALWCRITFLLALWSAFVLLRGPGCLWGWGTAAEGILAATAAWFAADGIAAQLFRGNGAAHRVGGSSRARWVCVRMPQRVRAGRGPRRQGADLEAQLRGSTSQPTT